MKRPAIVCAQLLSGNAYKMVARWVTARLSSTYLEKRKQIWRPGARRSAVPCRDAPSQKDQLRDVQRGLGGTLVVEHDIEERAMHVQYAIPARPAFVINEPQRAELIHKETDARAGGADHLG